MGLMDRFRGGSSPDLDHYEIKVYTDKGGKKRPRDYFREFDTGLEDIDGLDKPLDKEVVKNTAESEGWPSGKYVLEAKAVNGSILRNEWTFTHEGSDDTGELSDMERLERQVTELRRQLEDGAGGSISSPDEAYGEVFRRALDGEIDTDTNMQQLRMFLDEWRAASQGPAESPDEMAARIMDSYMQTGDREAATNILGSWFEAEKSTRDSGKPSLLEQLSSSDLDGIDKGDVKTLAYLRFLDDPREFSKGISSGLLDSMREMGGSGVGGGRGGEAADSGESGFEQVASALAGRDRSQEPTEEPEPEPEPEPAPESDPDREPTPEPDMEPTGADVGVIGMDDTEGGPGGQEDDPGAEPSPESRRRAAGGSAPDRDGSAETAAQERDDDAAERGESRRTGGGGGPERGEIYDGAEAMEAMTDAAEDGRDPETAVGDLDPAETRTTPGMAAGPDEDVLDEGGERTETEESDGDEAEADADAEGAAP